jgi:DNA repair exonuclease SbcCD ATPase subunit
MSTVEQINSQVQTLKTRLQAETEFNNQLKQKLSTIFGALGAISKSLDKVGNTNNELSMMKTKLEAANKRIADAAASDADTQKAVAQLGEVVGQLNSIDLNSHVAPDGIIANAQKTISQIQGQLAKLTTESATAPTALNSNTQNMMRGGRRRRRRGGYSYRKKSPSARKTRKSKKSKTRSKTRSKTHSRTRSRTR